MFRIKESEVAPRISWAMLALLAAILAATLVTVWVAWMLNGEQAMVADLVTGKAQASSDVVRGLPAKFSLQHNLTIVILVILIATALGLLMIRRAFLDSRQSLRDVKVLAGDILASMDQGVVTTTCDGVITSINWPQPADPTVFVWSTEWRKERPPMRSFT
jgi:hypothetical protein